MFHQSNPSNDAGRDQLRSPSSNGPPTEALDATSDPVRAVNDPVSTAYKIFGNELRFTFSGKPRLGAAHAFSKLLAGEFGLPEDVQLDQVVMTSTLESAVSNYVYTYHSANPAALESVAKSLVDEFARVAYRLPAPHDGRLFSMRLSIRPDCQGQLAAVLNLTSAFSEEHAGEPMINIHALVGSQVTLPELGPCATLDFVLGFPEQLVPKTREFRLAVEQLGQQRREQWGEEWIVTFDEYGGDELDMAAGAFHNVTPRKKRVK